MRNNSSQVLSDNIINKSFQFTTLIPNNNQQFSHINNASQQFNNINNNLNNLNKSIQNYSVQISPYQNQNQLSNNINNNNLSNSIIDNQLPFHLQNVSQYNNINFNIPNQNSHNLSINDLITKPNEILNNNINNNNNIHTPNNQLNPINNFQQQSSYPPFQTFIINQNNIYIKQPELNIQGNQNTMAINNLLQNQTHIANNNFNVNNQNTVKNVNNYIKTIDNNLGPMKNESRSHMSPNNDVFFENKPIIINNTNDFNRDISNTPSNAILNNQVNLNRNNYVETNQQYLNNFGRLSNQINTKYLPIMKFQNQSNNNNNDIVNVQQYLEGGNNNMRIISSNNMENKKLKQSSINNKTKKNSKKEKEKIKITKRENIKKVRTTDIVLSKISAAKKIIKKKTKGKSKSESPISFSEKFHKASSLERGVDKMNSKSNEQFIVSTILKTKKPRQNMIYLTEKILMHLHEYTELIINDLFDGLYVFNDRAKDFHLSSLKNFINSYGSVLARKFAKKVPYKNEIIKILIRIVRNKNEILAKSIKQNCIPSNDFSFEFSLFLRKKKMDEIKDLFVFPFKGINSVVVTTEDEKRLISGKMFNDNLIEFCIKWLENVILTEEQKSDIHFFNTFFFEQLYSRRSLKPNKMYESVKKWTSKVDIFDKKYIFIPINEAMHWYLMMIYNPNAYLNKDDENKYLDEVKFSICSTPSFINTDKDISNDSYDNFHEVQRDTEINDEEINQSSNLYESSDLSKSIIEDKVSFVNNNEIKIDFSQDNNYNNSKTPANIINNNSIDYNHENSNEKMNEDEDMVVEIKNNDNNSDNKGKTTYILDDIPIDFTPNNNKKANNILTNTTTTTTTNNNNNSNKVDIGKDNEKIINNAYEIIDINVNNKDLNLINIKNIESDKNEEKNMEINKEKIATKKSGILNNNMPKDVNKIEIDNIDLEEGNTDNKYEIKFNDETKSKNAILINNRNKEENKGLKEKKISKNNIDLDDINLIEEQKENPNIKILLENAVHIREALNEVNLKYSNNSLERLRTFITKELALKMINFIKALIRKEIRRNQYLESSSSKNSPKLQIDLSSVKESKKVTTFNNRYFTRTNINPEIIEESNNILENLNINKEKPRKALSKDNCYIVIFDSISGKHPTAAKIINSYLASEASHKKNIDIDKKIRCLYAKVPKQSNSLDCGVYLIKYIETFLQDPDKYMDMVLVSKRDDNEWFSKESIKKKREDVRDLIIHLTKEYKKEMEKKEKIAEFKVE
ncbi:cysteine proteinase [Piromyces finnis]|uniref:Cysteine proteinase n=1 Tax=Piromyces finnis TaxID=1754191 RepID=A0A1Y1VHD7_9FUNG|nr:cysteine proteinase [Piromyces finnis]|eukprot:ORX55493.1 cysteine proteinase [Piromyces finnis]